MAERLCSIEGCGRKHKAKGWCRNHYRVAAYAADPDFREKERARKRACRAGNPEKTRARAVAYYAANREKIKAAQAAYYAANKERVSARKVAWFANLSGPEYNELLLKARRRKALARMKKRHQTKERVDG